MPAGVVCGNAAADGDRYRGWLVGHFVEPAGDPRRTGDVSVKWGVHPAGEARTAWAANAVATTLSILVRGRFRIIFPDGECLLAREGDYALWAPGTPHHWHAETDSVVLTVRWPSRPGDSVDVPPLPAGQAG
jgi:hypothetical protein